MLIIPATQDAEIRKMMVPAQPGQKVGDTSPQQQKNWVWWCTCHPSYTGSPLSGWMEQKLETLS
jgi:glucuronate isomerase